VEKAALADLKLLEGEVSVVSIVGPYRTGMCVSIYVCVFVCDVSVVSIVSPHLTVFIYIHVYESI
jgi:hypothetical protein